MIAEVIFAGLPAHTGRLMSGDRRQVVGGPHAVARGKPSRPPPIVVDAGPIRCPNNTDTTLQMGQACLMSRQQIAAMLVQRHRACHSKSSKLFGSLL